MLTSSNHSLIAISPAHSAPEIDEPAPDLDDLALDDKLCPRGGGAQVGRVERPAHAEVGPEAWARDQGQAGGGCEVEDACCAAAVCGFWGVGLVLAGWKGVR
jgi:hypothetical protein